MTITDSSKASNYPLSLIVCIVVNSIHQLRFIHVYRQTVVKEVYAPLLVQIDQAVESSHYRKD